MREIILIEAGLGIGGAIIGQLIRPPKKEMRGAGLFCLVGMIAGSILIVRGGVEKNLELVGWGGGVFLTGSVGLGWIARWRGGEETAEVEEPEPEGPINWEEFDRKRKEWGKKTDKKPVKMPA